jgi:hypothetical protein
MKRFLIFLFFFPGVATISYYAVLYALSGTVPDSVAGVGLICLISIGPALLIALVDWSVTSWLKIGVVGTAFVAYGISVVYLAWALGVSKEILALGLIGAIPAAVCSWLSRDA